MIRTKTTWLAATVLVLSGCSSLPDSIGANPDVDQAKVSAVENAAQRSGTRVIWVNMPRKPSSQN
jgi:starvation-inducible outer membrane lipoprotein